MKKIFNQHKCGRGLFALQVQEAVAGQFKCVDRAGVTLWL